MQTFPWFNMPDGPSMGDPVFVEAQVRQMLEELRRILCGIDDPDINPQLAMPALAYRWARVFDARNEQLAQTMSPEAQDTWLKSLGYGTEDTEPGQPVLALVANTLLRFTGACQGHQEGRLHDDQAQFEIDTAVEDCVMFLLGPPNPAD